MAEEEGVFVETVELPPEPPPSGAVQWLRDNLFYSISSGLLTLTLGAITLIGVRTFLGWFLDPFRKWASVTENARLLMVQAYPQEEFHRVWIALGIVAVLAGLSLAVWQAFGMMSVERITRGMMAAGSIVAVGSLLAPLGEEGLTSVRIMVFVAGAVIAGAGYLWKRTAGDGLKEDNIPTALVAGFLLAIGVLALWTIKLPVQETFADGTKEVFLQRIATSTTAPWTLLIAALAVSYLVGRVLPESALVRRLLVVGWMLSFPVILMFVLRAPATEWNLVAVEDLPIFLGVGVVVSLILYLFGNPAVGEWKYLVSALWLLVAIAWVFVSFLFFDPNGMFQFVIPFTTTQITIDPGFTINSTFDVLQVLEFKFPLLLGALFALAAPSFGGPRAARLRYLVVWWVALFGLIVAFRSGASATSLELAGSQFVGGLALTFTLAIGGLALSFPLGVLMALGRASTMPIVRMICTTYIELVRSVPLITWLFFGANLLNLFLKGVIDVNEIVRAIIAVALFSAAYLAENVRGGLQSIPKGQYEAADAVGMSVVQKTVLITLPQALKAVIPALVGQVIALFKDTSLVAIIGLFDLLYIARTIIPNQSANIGSLMETTVTAAVVYWIFTFTFSRSSMRLEKRLGLGTR